MPHRWSIGAFFAPLSLSLFKKTDPNNFKTPLFIQFGLLGVMAIIFVLLPESPWFLVTKGKLEQAHKNLTLVNGGVKGYDVDYELRVMVNTIEQERRIASTFGEQSLFQRYVDCFRGVNKVSSHAWSTVIHLLTIPFTMISGELLPPTCRRAATILPVWPYLGLTRAVSHSPPSPSIAYNRLTTPSQASRLFPSSRLQ
jgi:hypothetical protein